MSHFNSRCNALSTLIVTVLSVKMPVCYGKPPIKSMGRPFSVIAHLKSSIVEVKADENCLANVLIIPNVSVEIDPNYTAYRKCRKILPVVQAVRQQTGFDLTNGRGSPNLTVSRTVSGL